MDIQLLLKRLRGGGGKGIRVARHEEELIKEFKLQQAEYRFWEPWCILRKVR